MNRYSIAFQMESGEFDIIDTFEAKNDAAANKFAEKHYPDQEWYVLNAEGENINS